MIDIENLTDHQAAELTEIRRISDVALETAITESNGTAGHVKHERPA